MKRMLVLLLMAMLVAMIFNQSWAVGKKSNDQIAATSQNFEVTVVATRSVTKGGIAEFVVSWKGGKEPVVITCDGKLVNRVFHQQPDSTASYLIIVKDASGNTSSSTVQIDVFSPARAEFYIGEFKVGKMDPKTINSLDEKIQPMKAFLDGCAAQDITLESKWAGYANTKKASRRRNQELAGGRAHAIANLVGWKLKVSELDTIIETNRLGVRVLFTETKESLVKRMGKSQVENIPVASQPPDQVPQVQTINHSTIRSIFDRISVGVGHEASPYGYNGVIGVGSVTLAGNPDSTGGSLSITGTFGRTSLNGLSYLETHQAEVALKYNILPWLGVSASGGYRQWANVYNQPRIPEKYNRYTQQFVGWQAGPAIEIGPLTVAHFWAQGSLDSWNKSGVQKYRQVEKENGVAITVDPIKLWRLIF